MKISLITMAQGNSKALKSTLDSFYGIYDEVIFGDLLLFQEDRDIIRTYEHKYNLKMEWLPFDYIFQNGFASVLNRLADKAKNDIVLYMNVGEVIDGEHRIPELLDFFETHNYNCFPFDHASDPHHWYRMYKKSELKWGGIIHETLQGEYRKCPWFMFRMADTEKDLDNPFKAKVYNDVKEIVYFRQYTKLAENPELMDGTDVGWVLFAKKEYDSMMKRLNDKGARYQAFLDGDMDAYLAEVNTSKEFEAERFETSKFIEFQGDARYLGKQNK